MAESRRLTANGLTVWRSTLDSPLSTISGRKLMADGQQLETWCLVDPPRQNNRGCRSFTDCQPQLLTAEQRRLH